MFIDALDRIIPPLIVVIDRALVGGNRAIGHIHASRLILFVPQEIVAAMIVLYRRPRPVRETGCFLCPSRSSKAIVVERQDLCGIG
jgi:hypothetical protein